MSQPTRNGTIMSFFRPTARRQTPQPIREPQREPQPREPQPSSPPSLSSIAPSSPLSKPSTPAKPQPAFTRDLEIGASDDDDGFSTSSDDSLEDLSAILGRGRPGKTPYSTSRNPTTPRSKRTAIEFPASPLTLTPKHKFDLKALAKDARKDSAINASSVRNTALADLYEESDPVPTGEASRGAFEGIVKNEGGHDAQKVLRAVQRSEGGGQSQARYCFFSDEYSPPQITAPRRVNSPWNLLAQGDVNTREQHLASGILTTISVMHGGLPDEVFNWMLDELCTAKSYLIRQEYCNILSKSPEQIEKLVTPQRLEQLLLLLGATSELTQRDSKLTISKLNVDPYQGREWSCLGQFLGFLKVMAPLLSLPSVAYASQSLLRMAMDKIIMYNIDILDKYEGAIDALLNAIPRPQWDSFCFKTCSLLHTIFEAQYVRVNALLCLPVSKTTSHELRRRLAVVFLFDDPALGRHHPDGVVTIPGIIIRLAEDDFAVGPETDFASLQAGIILVNIVVDDGSFTESDDLEAEKQFNADIDELTGHLRQIWKMINDTGMKLARTEAKSVIDWVQQRLTHTVRTRRKAKENFYNVLGQKRDPNLPKQQDYMKNFLRKAPESKLSEPAPESKAEEPSPTFVDADTIVVAGL
ncbi:hypothetical protein B0J13DRAFT_169898 [Dactylonectria estremocensis]|uniref:Uncharacterized protein n=1 Tax=Dactylonectria estremocensis TaxID=1079267 RepID=A0A9P9JEQ0_9HYPO|nr:hypothetical protein B0J13DRAFT_169898 [Dactylonectria estremocensis]